ncbi:MAG: hypothetical protein ABEJ23_08615 [Haloarculaceae archaeon]
MTSDGWDRYHCRVCDVTFRERFPRFYDVTPCPGCGTRATNVALRPGLGGRTLA